MAKAKLERSAGWAGLGQVACWVVGVATMFSAGPPPGTDTQQVVSYLARSPNVFHVFALADTLAIGGTFWMLVGLRERATVAQAAASGPASVALGTAVVSGTLAAAGGWCLSAAAASVTARASGAAVVLWELGGVLLGPASEITTAIFVAAATIASMQSRAFPRSTTVAGWLCAGLNLVAAPSVFGGLNPGVFYSATGMAGLGLGLVPLLVWSILLSLALLRLP